MSRPRPGLAVAARGALFLLLVLQLAPAGPLPAQAAGPVASPVARIARSEIVVRVPNSGFEVVSPAAAALPQGWILEKGENRATTLGLSGRYTHSGRFSLRLEHPAGKSALARSRQLPATPGAVYTAATYVWNEVGSGWLYLEFWDAAGQRLSFEFVESHSLGALEQMQVSAAGPPDSVAVSVALYGSTSQAGISYFDDVSLVRNGDPEVAADSCNAADIANGGFETGSLNAPPAGWEIDDSGSSRVTTLWLSDQHVHSGSLSLRLEHPAGKSVLARSRRLPAVPGAVYTATAYVWNESGSGRLYLEFWDAAGKRLNVEYAEAHSLNTLEHMQVQAAGPPGGVAVSVTLYGSTSEAGVAYFDDVSLTHELPGVVDVGGCKQLFLDDGIVESLDGVTRIVHPAEKYSRPLIVPDRPWEFNNVYVYGQVLYDQEERLFKMWYFSIHREVGSAFTLYATSLDGLNWTKPALGLYDFQGSTANNIVGEIQGPLSVIKDLQELNPARRYKMFAYDANFGYSVYFSPDGLRWTPYEHNPVLPGGDVATAFYDERHGRFVALTKIYVGLPAALQRAVAVSYSPDFIHWTPQKLALHADALDLAGAHAQGYHYSDIYGMGVMQYTDQYVGFPWVFRYIKPPNEGDDGPIDVEVAFSRDLETWQRPNRQPAIERGPAGAWDSGMIFTTSSPILARDRIMVYYGGWDGLHSAPDRTAGIGLASWRLDGFVSLSNGGGSTGTLTTRPLVFSGASLVVNANVTGWLAVEVLDADGEVIDGYGREDSVPLAGNAVQGQARWNGCPDLGALNGRPVRLRFYLFQAELYSFQFQPAQAADGQSCP